MTSKTKWKCQRDAPAKLIVCFLLIFEVIALVFGIISVISRDFLLALFLIFISFLLPIVSLLWLYIHFQTIPAFLVKKKLRKKEIKFLTRIDSNQDSINSIHLKQSNLQTDYQIENAKLLEIERNRYFQHGLNTVKIINANIPGIGKADKALLTYYGITTANDINSHNASFEKLGATKTKALQEWRNKIFNALDQTKPTNIPSLQKEQIKTKFIFIYSENLEDERKHKKNLAILQKQLEVIKPRIQEYAQVTFRNYLKRILSFNGIKGGVISSILIVSPIVLAVSTIAGLLIASIKNSDLEPIISFNYLVPNSTNIESMPSINEPSAFLENPTIPENPHNIFTPTSSNFSEFIISSKTNTPSPVFIGTSVSSPILTNTSVATNPFIATVSNVPTNTPTSNNTTIPTNTPTAAKTIVPTFTPSMTKTPSFTPTPSLLPTNGNTTVLAFPEAEGYGAGSIGGRGGKVYEVTNTNDSGAGSLRSCVEASGSRICVFRTGGLISLNSPLSIKNPYLTIAGQTAPGGGITIKLGSSNEAFLTKTHDVIIRYITVRPGPGGSNHGNQIAENGVTLYNIMIDHSTYSWGVDSNIETWYRVTNSTIQWSIISEALNCSTHTKGCHSKGLMIGGYKGAEGSTTKGSENISVLNNLMASNLDRNPLMQMCGIGQVINNVTYNAGTTFSHQQLNCPNYTSYVNWINNFHKKGPSGSSTDLKIIPSDDGVCSSGKVYMLGNVGNNGSWTYSFSGSCASQSSSILSGVPAPAPEVVTSNATNAYNNVLAKAGNSSGLNCDGTWFSRRDAIDLRIVNEVISGTGRIIDDPSQVGGWITPSSGTPCMDTDHDGMPDVWEQAHGLNPFNTGDGSLVSPSGYTNLEMFLNGSN